MPLCRQSLFFRDVIVTAWLRLLRCFVRPLFDYAAAATYATAASAAATTYAAEICFSLIYVFFAIAAAIDFMRCAHAFAMLRCYILSPLRCLLPRERALLLRALSRERRRAARCCC